MNQTLTLEIPDDLYQVLKEMADKLCKTPEDMSAEWLAAAIEQLANDPVEKFIGAFDTDIPDWADQHDKYIGEALMEAMRDKKHEGN